MYTKEMRKEYKCVITKTTTTMAHKGKQRRWTEKNYQAKKKMEIEIVSSSQMRITLNVNALNLLIKRHRLTERNKNKTKSNYMSSIRDSLFI